MIRTCIHHVDIAEALFGVGTTKYDEFSAHSCGAVVPVDV
jgi:hypothetical protein